MTIQQLKYVISISQYGSMNEAAKKLFISQPSLSSSVKDLEEELGITIFKRTNKGIDLTKEGAEFLTYARQIAEQMELVESRYVQNRPVKQNFAVSTQHYSFAVNAFVDVVKEFGREEYELTLKETKTYEIIDDVKNMRSEIGVLYLNEFNERVINKFIKENNLEFHLLFEAKPHVFISVKNPLSKKEIVTLDDLDEYPCLTFEQGEYNSFHFSEEILSTVSHKKNIHVSDRATLFNLLIGLNGYTISTGVLSSELNGDQIISVPLQWNETIRVGYITYRNISLTKLGIAYIEALEKIVEEIKLEIH